MTRLLKDPLVHFLLIGAALFAFSAWRGASIETGRERIVIGAAQVAQLRDAAALVQGRAPTRAELEALVEPTIRDEVLYREALALGLDVNDDEVRRRLIEKMQYLTQDTADPEPESEAELRAFYAASPERFTMPERVSFEQVYLSPSGRGAALETDIAAALESLRAGADPQTAGDRTPLRARYDAAPREQVAVLLGDDLANALFTMEPGRWQGPYRSDFGVHLVRLNARAPSRLPPFDEIRAQVAEAFGAARRQRENEAQYRAMRARYDVVVEWPEEPAAAPAAEARAPGAAP
jgi:hypothetical protein